jgi:hypothetical protein
MTLSYHPPGTLAVVLLTQNATGPGGAADRYWTRRIVRASDQCFSSS